MRSFFIALTFLGSIQAFAGEIVNRHAGDPEGYKIVASYNEDNKTVTFKILRSDSFPIMPQKTVDLETLDSREELHEKYYLDELDSLDNFYLTRKNYKYNFNGTTILMTPVYLSLDLVSLPLTIPANLIRNSSIRNDLKVIKKIILNKDYVKKVDRGRFVRLAGYIMGNPLWPYGRDTY